MFLASAGVEFGVAPVASVGRGGRTERGSGGVGARLVVARGLERGILFSMVFCRPRMCSFRSSISSC